jgi:hypothetical protein
MISQTLEEVVVVGYGTQENQRLFSLVKLLVMEHWKTGSFVSATNVARSKLLVFKLF